VGGWDELEMADVTQIVGAVRHLRTEAKKNND
jgi:hypothetical protein